jgi:PEP-CTERM motif
MKFDKLLIPLVLVFAIATFAMGQTDVTAPTDLITLVNGVNDGDGNSGAPPTNEGVIRAIDNAGQKYLNFLDLGSGFIVTPSLGIPQGGTIVTGIRLYTANDAVERDPASYELAGSLNGINFTVISAGALALPAGRNNGGFSEPLGSNFQTLLFANSTAYTSYRVIFPTLKNAAAANSMQISEVELLGVVAPEPSSMALLGLGAIGLLRRARRTA